MKMRIYSVYDAAVSAYLQPFFARSDNEAVRSFKDACETTGHQFQKYALDYTLLVIGEFSDENGGLVPCPPRRIAIATEFASSNILPSLSTDNLTPSG